MSLWFPLWIKIHCTESIKYYDELVCSLCSVVASTWFITCTLMSLNFSFFYCIYSNTNFWCSFSQYNLYDLHYSFLHRLKPTLCIALYCICNNKNIEIGARFDILNFLFLFFHWISLLSVVIFIGYIAVHNKNNVFPRFYRKIQICSVASSKVFLFLYSDFPF